MAEPKGKAFQTVRDTAPQNTYRGAVVGCGRMGSTIDDEHIGMPHYPWPWAHAPAMIEARGSISLPPPMMTSPNSRTSNSAGTYQPCTPITGKWSKKNKSTWSA